MSLIRVLCIFSFGFCILSCGKNLNVGKNKLKDGAGNEISDNILIPKKEAPATAEEAFKYFIGAFQEPYQQGCIFSQDLSNIKGATETTVSGKKVITVNGESGSFIITLLAGNTWDASNRQLNYRYQNYGSQGLILNDINATGADPFFIKLESSNKFEIKAKDGIAISGFFTATLKASNDLIEIEDCNTLEYDNPLIFTYKHKDGDKVLELKKTENLELFKMFLNKT